jgi:hypothetical protein
MVIGASQRKLLSGMVEESHLWTEGQFIPIGKRSISDHSPGLQVRL